MIKLSEQMQNHPLSSMDNMAKWIKSVAELERALQNIVSAWDLGDTGTESVEAFADLIHVARPLVEITK